MYILINSGNTFKDLILFMTKANWILKLFQPCFILWQYKSIKNTQKGGIKIIKQLKMPFKGLLAFHSTIMSSPFSLTVFQNKISRRGSKILAFPSLEQNPSVFPEQRRATLTSCCRCLQRHRNSTLKEKVVWHTTKKILVLWHHTKHSRQSSCTYRKNFHSICSHKCHFPHNAIVQY